MRIGRMEKLIALSEGTDVWSWGLVKGPRLDQGNKDVHARYMPKR